MSNFFEWDPARYSVKVPQMDTEHQAIISSMNKLHELYKAQVSGPKLVQAVNELGSITVRHFADEEAYMQKIGFPDLAKHKIIHKTLLENFTRHKEQADATGKVTEEFFNFLKMWLKAHICGIDIKYGEFRKAA